MKARKKTSSGASREIERAQTLTRMIAGFVHQFRTPLHVIASSSENLKHYANLPKDLQGDLSLIERSVNRLQSAVQNLLNFAKGDAVPWSMRSINDPINHAADFLKDECTKRKLMLKLHEDVNVPPIRMQAEWLEEAIMNLAINGMEAMSPGGTLTITTEQDAQRRVCVKIQDTGAGMTPAALKHLGNAFTTGKKGGVGLGVFFALEIFKRHKARPRYTSELGVGTCVTITFP